MEMRGFFHILRKFLELRESLLRCVFINASAYPNINLECITYFERKHTLLRKDNAQTQHTPSN